jgi:hypothetical protein
MGGIVEGMVKSKHTVFMEKSNGADESLMDSLARFQDGGRDSATVNIGLFLFVCLFVCMSLNISLILQVPRKAELVKKDFVRCTKLN